MKIYLDALILDLLKTMPSVTLRDIAAAANMNATSAKDSRAIQRALKSLIEDRAIMAHGNARARHYTLPVKADEDTTQYLSKPLSERSPVAYQQTFLSSYIPNKTYYLDSATRQELAGIGLVENITRPAGTYARHIYNRLLIDLSFNSSRLEGNTYSLLETKQLIEFGEIASGKDAFEAQMILNHKEAIEYIIESANEKTISAHEIYSIHALLSNNLLGDPSASGRIRNIAVGISGTSYLPIDNPHLLKEYFTMFVDKLNQIQNPFEQSFFSLVHLSYLQAFQDVNKRTARLVANIPLIKQNLKPLSFTDVETHRYMMALLGIYEKTDVSLLRELYLWAYNKSAQRYSAIQQSMGEPDTFKLKYRLEIQTIIREIIKDKVIAAKLVPTIKQSVQSLNIPAQDREKLFQEIEIEIMSLHDGNIARFKVLPSEFLAWKKLQK